MNIGKRKLEIKLNDFHDISIPPKRFNPVNAYDLPNPMYSIFSTEGFTGNVRQGGSCNVEELYLVPHGNGTHTECVGHISIEPVWIDSCLAKYFFSALLLSVEPEEEGDSWIIRRHHLEASYMTYQYPTEALILRTLPNPEGKVSRRYAGTHPPYLSEGAINFINENGFKHLLVDLPSVDHENDSGLKAHHLFWNYPSKPERDKTITELIYVPDKVTDGYYMLNLQVASLQSDASLSRPILFPAEIKR